MAYSENEKQEALIRLAINKYNYEMTASDMGIPSRTLRRWDKNVKNVTKNIPGLLERAIQRLLMVIPKEMSGHDWAVTLGILIDKWQLIRGEPTSRTENIFVTLSQMTDDELDTLYAEFQAAANRRVIDTTGKDTPE